MATQKSVEWLMGGTFPELVDGREHPLYLRGRSPEGHTETAAGGNVDQEAQSARPPEDPGGITSSGSNASGASGSGPVKTERGGQTKPGQPTGPTKFGLLSDDDINFVSEKVQEFIRDEGENARLQNDWRLIEESWQRVELFHRNATEYFGQGLGLQVDEAGRLMATITLPYWKVDLPAALRAIAAEAARREFGVLPPVPLRFGSGEKAIQLGYSVLPRRAAFTVDWGDTAVTIAAGRPRVIRIPVSGGQGKKVRSSSSIENYSVEVKSGSAQLESFYDREDKVYRQKVEVADIGVDVLHDFEGTTSAPSDVSVTYKDFRVGVAADSKDAEYGVSVGDKANSLEVSRDFDDRTNHLKGHFGDVNFMWENDSKDDRNSGVSARLEVGNPVKGLLVSGGVERDDDKQLGGSAGFKAKDAELQLEGKGDRLDGELKLGKIKYKIELRGGLPDFILIS
ncbi:hypothetical protein CSUI_001360 [Cystoisospora suis]|uniref:Uncharacterized protein n=1 Tax=Cystoisospora suis TaxID=483139 RepID=A0A2C6KXS9_9APIC|nr:hypothetical protein CSUI_001360 [Cystoisospora suis]